MNRCLKAALGLLVTILAVAAKLAAYLNNLATAIFDNTAVSMILLLLMAFGLFMFAYYTLPERLSEVTPYPPTCLNELNDPLNNA